MHELKKVYNPDKNIWFEGVFRLFFSRLISDAVFLYAKIKLKL